MDRTSYRMLVAAAASTYFLYYASTSVEWHFIDSVNLIFHEAGHAIFFFLGQFGTIAMGSGFQILIPLLIASYFFYTEQRLSAAICLLWTGQNLINVSVYAGDAIAMRLPLLGGDSVIHDWSYMLSTLHVLSWTPAIAMTLYALGIMLIGCSIPLAFLFAARD
jgi:hypothetical protein